MTNKRLFSRFHEQPRITEEFPFSGTAAPRRSFLLSSSKTNTHFPRSFETFLPNDNAAIDPEFAIEEDIASGDSLLFFCLSMASRAKEPGDVQDWRLSCIIR